jgi:hypothetical protein
MPLDDRSMHDHLDANGNETRAKASGNREWVCLRQRSDVVVLAEGKSGMRDQGTWV